MKVKQVREALEADGWRMVRQGGRSSHRIYKKDGVVAAVALSGQDSHDITPGQLQDIRRKSGLPIR